MFPSITKTGQLGLPMLLVALVSTLCFAFTGLFSLVSYIAIKSTCTTSVASCTPWVATMTVANRQPSCRILVAGTSAGRASFSSAIATTGRIGSTSTGTTGWMDRPGQDRRCHLVWRNRTGQNIITSLVTALRGTAGRHFLSEPGSRTTLGKEPVTSAKGTTTSMMT